MSAAADFFASALAEAVQPGAECEPTQLLKVADQSDPITAVGTYDGGNELFGALTEKFGFLEVLRIPNAQPSEEVRARLVGLLRWAMRSLHEWSRVSDPSNRLLVSLFVISRYCRHAGPFWAEMPDAVGNPALATEIGAMLGRMRVNIAPGDVRHEPISHHEAIERFNEADKIGNWPQLVEGLRSFAYFPDTFIPEAVGYLNRFDRRGLIEVTSGVHQTLMIIRILEPLTAEERCQLSLDTDNHHLDFGVVYCSLIPPLWQNKPEPIPSLLSSVFVKIAGDEVRWSQCMAAFNRYPVRYPALAPILGESLASVSDAAVKTYVNSISLSAHPGESRKTVADALLVFQSLATAERRKYLWREAYGRWKKWNFGNPEIENLTANIGQSELDFALVGYSVECMSPAERDEVCKEVCAKLSVLDQDWHKSYSGFLAEKNRLLSQFQPVAHAMNVSSPDQWLSSVAYLPFDKAKERYAALLLRA